MARLQFLPRDRRNTGLLPWVIAVMVYLTALALAIGLAFHSGVRQWSEGLSTSLTVQIVTPDDAAAERQTRAAVDLLNKTPGIAQARALPHKELVALLEPWLGAGNVTEDLPVPRLIDVRAAPDRPLDKPALEAALRGVAPDARLDDHQQWLGQLVRLAATAQWISLVIVAMIALATIAIVVFATKSGLASHHENIEIMHLIGAHDGAIAGEFQTRFWWQGFKGGLIGLVLTGLSLFSLYHLTSQFDQGLLPQLALSAESAIGLLALPLLAGLTTMITARLTVMNALRDMV